MATKLLEGKKGVIFGALNDLSMAWKIAERAYEEGAEIVLSNTAMAIRMGDVKQLAEKLNTQVIPADVTKVADIEAVYKGAMEQFGGSFDFLLHSVGMSPNVRKKVPYDQIDYNKFAMTMDISAMSFHKMIQTAKKWKPLPNGVPL